MRVGSIIPLFFILLSISCSKNTNDSKDSELAEGYGTGFAGGSGQDSNSFYGTAGALSFSLPQFGTWGQGDDA